jgi:LysM repeat protein
MLKYSFLAIVTLFFQYAHAQETDSIYAVRKGPGLAIDYTSKPKESVNMIASRFYSSADKIESASMVDGKKKLPPGTTLTVPLNKANFNAAREKSGMDNQQEIYYKVREKDNVALIALLAGIQKHDLITWNSLHGNSLQEGQALFIGWVKVVPKDSINLSNGIAYPSVKTNVVIKDTSTHSFGELDSLYNAQTSNGNNTITEKGTAVFFEKAGSNKIFYAFHSTSRRGAIIKIVNPGTGKMVYAKVLGPLPDTKLYANSIIGITSSAKEALGIAENKAWCELVYAPN